ncbi:MAG: DUF4114 domain-containing protein [Thainema sp.]
MSLTEANGSGIVSSPSGDLNFISDKSFTNLDPYLLNTTQIGGQQSSGSGESLLPFDSPEKLNPAADQLSILLSNPGYSELVNSEFTSQNIDLVDEADTPTDTLIGQDELTVGSVDTIEPLLSNVITYSPYVPGVFVAGDSGQVSIDFLFDGGGYSNGQVAIFSVEGMDTLVPGSTAFNQEAAYRARSNSELGHIVINDRKEGARFSGILNNNDPVDRNGGEYLGPKTFQMEPGSLFAVMLVPNGKVQDVLNNPAVEGAKKPLYSITDANPGDTTHLGQMLDVVGDGTTFTMEDQRTDAGSDMDMDDIIFKVSGAIGYAPLMSDSINPDNDWRYSPLGQEILAYVSTNDNPEKLIPDEPVRDPILPAPQIPISITDQGSNTLTEPTPTVKSPTQDIIDQVSSSDATDTYRVNVDELTDTQFTVLTGTTKVSILNSSGTLLSSQTLTKGSHSLLLPAGVTNDALIQVDQVGDATATYVLSGLESQAEEPFNIDLELDEGLTASQQAVINAAAQSIEGLIRQGLPSAIVDGKIIDDLNVKFNLGTLDGAGGTLAQTKIDFMRYGILLPAQSIVQFDQDDFADLEQSGELFNVVQHELLHALGFGNLWEAKGLVDYAKTPFAQYNGQYALAAFKEAGGATNFISLDTEGEGSADLHWNENLFQDEIMTRDLNAQGGDAVISRVTLASLRDLGYVVDAEGVPSDLSLSPEDIPQDFVTGFTEEEKFSLAQLVADAETQVSNGIPAVVPTVDANEIAPTIWANAERFDKNGEYYDWEWVIIQPGNTISQYVYDRMTDHTGSDNRTRLQKASDPAYWAFISERNGFPDPNWIVAGDPAWLPVWHPNYEQEQEEERRRREEELRQREEEERQQREKLEEAYRQSGQGGLEWYVAKPLPDFSTSAPYTTEIQDIVGNLVPDDYFRFTLSRNGRVTLYLEDLLADADLYLYDSRNRLIGKSARGGLTDEKLILDLAAGTYLARVNSPGGVTTDYKLKVQFQGQLTRSQMGPPVGWVPGVGVPGGSGRPSPTFSDPRIERIFTTARDKFANEQWAQAQPQIDSLEAQKRQKQRELDQLLAEAIAQQKAKVNAALDNVRNDLTGRISGIADGIKHNIYWAAENGINAVNWLVPGWLQDKLDWLGLGDGVRSAQDTLRNAIRGARDWLNSQIDWVRNQINGAISQFIEMVKNAYLTGAEINAAIDGAANWLRSKTDSLVNFLNGKIGEFKGWILGKLEWTRNIRTPDWARRLGVPDWNLYDHAIAGLVDGATRGVQSAISGTGNLFKGVLDVATPLAQGAVAVIVDAIFGDQTGRLYNEINGINQKISSIKAGVQKAIQDQTAFYKNLLDGFLNGLGQAKDFIVGALMGEFNSQPSIWQTLLDAAIGMIPIVGEIGDVRDLIAFTAKFINDPNEMQDFWNWVGVVGAGIGLVPVVGGAIKGVTKLARNADLITEIRKLGPTIVNSVTDFARKTDWAALGNKTADFWDNILSTVENITNDLIEAMQRFKSLMPQLKLSPQPAGGVLPDEGFFAKVLDGIDELKRISREKIDEAFAFVQGKFDELASSGAKVLSGSPPFSQDTIRRFLDETESLGEGHIYARHISTGDLVADQKTLQTRLADRQRGSSEYYKDEFSMFWDKQSATQVITQAINSKYSEIEALVKANPQKAVKKEFSVSVNSSDTAFGINSVGEYIESQLTDIKLVIKTREDGSWFVLTAYPII